ncbi:MAG: cytochrome c [Elusimicrobia bacterium]|nr:cytochrome c [Elusimicrobiota bacterium]
MNRWLIPALLLALAAACSPQSEITDPAARGERDFNGLGCVKCHMIGDKGVDWGPNLTMLGFRKSPAWIDTWLKDPHAWNPKTVMPNFNLKDSTRADLVAYLSAQKGQAWKVKPWETPEAAALPAAERGKLIFNSVGCVSCHAKDGYGGYPNNNVAGGLVLALTKVNEGYTKPEAHQVIKGGRLSIPSDSTKPAPMLQMPKWGDKLSEKEIDDLVEYVFSLGPKVAAGKPSKDDF